MARTKNILTMVKIKQKGNYLENKKIGTFEYFNDQGELMYVIYYYEDDILGLSYRKGWQTLLIHLP